MPSKSGISLVLCLVCLWSTATLAEPPADLKPHEPEFLPSLLSRIEAKASTSYLGGLGPAPVAAQPALPPAAPPSPPTPQAPTVPASPVVEFLSVGSNQPPRAVVRMPEGGRLVLLVASALPDGRRVVSITYEAGVVVEDKNRKRSTLPYAHAPRAAYPVLQPGGAQ